MIVALGGERFRKGFSIGARYQSCLSADEGGQWRGKGQATESDNGRSGDKGMCISQPVAN